MDSGPKIPRKINPKEKINPLLALFFIHLFPIFAKSYRKGFTEESLFEPLEEHKSSKLGDELETIWLEEVKRHRRTALRRSLLKQFGKELCIIGSIKLTGEIVYLTVMSYSIGRLLDFFEYGPPKVTNEDAYLHAALLICTLALCNFTAHSCYMAMMHLGMKARIACCSLIYRKSLRLSQTSLAQTTIGHMINLLSNDVGKFDSGCILFHFIWTAPIESIVGTYLLYRKIGLSAFTGMAFLFLFVPLQIYIAKKNSKIRRKTALTTDKRVHLMQEILSGIQAIKMYAWERPFAQMVSLARRLEIKAIRMRYYLYAIIFSLDMFIMRSCIFISIVGFTYSGNRISANTAYTVAAIYSVLRSHITMSFLYSILSFGEILVTIGRLQKFMLLEEFSSSEVEVAVSETQNEKEHLLTKLNSSRKSSTPKIILKSVSAKWDNKAAKETLSDVSLNIVEKQLVAIIGPVGSGKSSLINVILKELAITNGYLETEGVISYASQKSWLFSESVRQNILFGLPYQEDRYRTVIKVCCLESDLKMFPNGDQTIVGEKGNALSGGQKARINLARCVYKDADVYLLDDPLSAVDIKVAKTLFEDCISSFLRGKICVLVTHQVQYLKDVDKIVVINEGKIMGDGRFKELQATGLDLDQILKDFRISDDEENDVVGDTTPVITELPLNLAQKIDISNKEVLRQGTIKISTYLKYIRAGGNYCVMLLLAMMFIAAQAIGNTGDYLVSFWVNLERATLQNNGSLSGNIFGIEIHNRKGIIYMYSGVTLATIILAFAHSFFFFMFFMRASINMHQMIFSKILSATMRFFNSNPVGRILNRFSKDIGVIDEVIPSILIDFFHIVLVFLGTIAVTSLTNYWLTVPVVIIIIFSYPLRKVYVVTSRTVKRLEGITRSSMFNHITASVDGLSTIRAFEKQNTLAQEFDRHQDLHSGAWYLFISSTRGFGLWIDVMYIVFLTSVVIGLLAQKRDWRYGGDIGLVLTQYLNLVGILQFGIRQWTDLENNMTSVERVLEYTKIETEPLRDSSTPLPKIWPNLGRITFTKVSLKYNTTDPPVINNLNFATSAAEKIGIVGRTGAGKSSTIAALFQLYKIDGTISIDEVDTTKIPLHNLRSKISIIPQTPVLFSGTIRQNLDPFEEYTDDKIWSALADVELKHSLDESALGLSAVVTDGGSNFSIGQRQLVCLARAILRNNRILVMDEATSNVDPHTDELIQKTIRVKFANCTVITIAHRLETVMDADRILVMDAGEVVEFGHPHELMQNSDSFLFSMVQATGKIASQNLQSAAKENYMRKKNI